jgi:hypothetical protein
LIVFFLLKVIILYTRFSSFAVFCRLRCIPLVVFGRRIPGTSRDLLFFTIARNITPHRIRLFGLLDEFTVLIENSNESFDVRKVIPDDFCSIDF